MRIPRLDTDCTLLTPALVVYSDLFHIWGVYQILVKQVIFELLVTDWKALAPPSADVQGNEGVEVNSCFVPC